MAVTFRGSICTRYMIPTRDSNCFVLEVTPRARCTVNILRLVMQFDAAGLSTGTGRIMPLVKSRKYTGTASGGIEMTATAPWDTTINDHDPGVILRMDAGYAGVNASDITVTGTPVTMWQQFSARQITGVEQFLSYDASVVSALAASTDIVIRPGEVLEVLWSEPVTATGGICFLEILWEEDRFDAGYTVGGAVTLEGAPVTGAKVLLVTDTDRDMPNPQIEILTTDGSGAYSKLVPSTVKASVHVQYRNGETLYNSEGKPYIGSA